MNKILEEEGTSKKYLELEEEFADHESSEYIDKFED